MAVNWRPVSVAAVYDRRGALEQRDLKAESRLLHFLSPCSPWLIYWDSGLKDFWILEKFFQWNSRRSNDKRAGLGVFHFECGEAGNFVGAAAFDFDA